MDDMTYMEVQEIDMHPLVSLLCHFLNLFRTVHHLCLALLLHVISLSSTSCRLHCTLLHLQIGGVHAQNSQAESHRQSASLPECHLVA